MASTRRRRREKNQQRSGVVLGVAGALIAALLVYQVFFRGGDDASPTATGPSVGEVIDGTTTTTTPLEPTLPNGSFDELSLRDPFEPIGQITPGTNTTVTTTTTTIPGTISTTPTTTPAQNPGGVNDVAMMDIYIDPVSGAQTARVRVGAAEYTVTAGQAFATNYMLVRFTSDSCADLTYASSPFPLCVGQQTVK